MQHVTIRIHSKNDPSPALPEVAEALKKGEAQAAEGTLEYLVILEGGMQSGKTSVALYLKTPDGNYALAQMSAAMFLTMQSAVKGAMARFGEDPSQYA